MRLFEPRVTALETPLPLVGLDGLPIHGCQRRRDPEVVFWPRDFSDTWFLGPAPKSSIFGVWAAAAAPKDHSRRWGAKPPAFCNGFSGCRGRPDPQNHRFPGGPKTMYSKPKGTRFPPCWGGARPPTFWNGFWGRRGRPDPPKSTIPGRPQNHVFKTSQTMVRKRS